LTGTTRCSRRPRCTLGRRAWGLDRQPASLARPPRFRAPRRSPAPFTVRRGARRRCLEQFPCPTGAPAPLLDWAVPGAKPAALPRVSAAPSSEATCRVQAAAAAATAVRLRWQLCIHCEQGCGPAADLGTTTARQPSGCMLPESLGAAPAYCCGCQLPRPAAGRPCDGHSHAIGGPARTGVRRSSPPAASGQRGPAALRPRRAAIRQRRAAPARRRISTVLLS